MKIEATSLTPKLKDVLLEMVGICEKANLNDEEITKVASYFHFSVEQTTGLKMNVIGDSQNGTN